MRKFLTKSDYIIVVAIFFVAVVLGVIIGYFVFGPISTYGAAGREEAEYVEYVECVYEETLPAFTVDEVPNMPLPMPCHSYVVTSMNGYIVVMYAALEGKAPQVKTITNTPVSPLPLVEQERLENGIYIYDEDALIRILEDFGS